ncbi:hypothetical protein P355_0396 [Burkholderia cenocepacia KC-01]|nr:hypothetical protein P355_0396 [Burkholderia cenocepacia KC-01]
MQVSCHRPDCAARHGSAGGRWARAGAGLTILHKTSPAGDDLAVRSTLEIGQGFSGQPIATCLQSEIIRLVPETSGRRYMETKTR